jgi:hypothetical protein
MRPVRRISRLTGALALVIAAGCGSDDPPDTPVACLEGPQAYLRALEAAPGDVRLDGTTPISDCLVEQQAPGAQAQVGEAMVAAATELNREIRRDGGTAVIERLGYLVGAVREAASGTGGIHEDLALRLDNAARYPGPQGDAFGAGFERAFGVGYTAGQERG